MVIVWGLRCAASDGRPPVANGKDQTRRRQLLDVVRFYTYNGTTGQTNSTVNASLVQDIP